MASVNHLTIDLDNVRLCPMLESYKEALSAFMIVCCRAINMNPLYGPIIVSGSDHNPGCTGVLIIDTSHIAVHQFDCKDGSCKVRIDVYSCKPFPAHIVTSLVDVYFPSDLQNIKTLDRWPI